MDISRDSNWNIRYSVLANPKSKGCRGQAITTDLCPRNVHLKSFSTQSGGTIVVCKYSLAYFRSLCNEHVCMFVWWRVLAQKKGRGLATITPDIGAVLLRILSPPPFIYARLQLQSANKKLL